MDWIQIHLALNHLPVIGLPLPLVRTRRNKINPDGKKINLRATLRQSSAN